MSIDERLTQESINAVRQVFNTFEMAAANKMRKANYDEVAIDRAGLESLDDNFISRQGRERLKITGRYIGGGSHATYHGAHIELADLLITFSYYERGMLEKSKFVLIQSKRLYPRTLKQQNRRSMEDSNNQSLADEGPRQFREASPPESNLYDTSSKYYGLRIGDTQWDAISDFEDNTGVQMFYMFQNPLQIPERSVQAGNTVHPASGTNQAGFRVVPARSLRDFARVNNITGSPSYNQLFLSNNVSAVQNWRVGPFIADEVLLCRQGYDPSKHRLPISDLPTFLRRKYKSSAVEIDIAVDLT